MHVYHVLSCFVCFVCILYVCMYIYIYIYIYIFMYVYICICVYIYVCSSLYIYAFFMYLLVHTFVCIKVICLSYRYLGCCFSVWHCYLGSTLAFSFEIVQLNTTTCTKSSTQVIKINLGNMNSLFPTLIFKNSGFMYLFI